MKKTNLGVGYENPPAQIYCPECKRDLSKPPNPKFGYCTKCGQGFAVSSEPQEIEPRLSMWIETAQKLDKKLLAAQAAIKAVLRIAHTGINEGGTCNAPLVYRTLESVDLSALEAHDKKFIKPLERIMEWSRASQPQRYRMEKQWFGEPVYDAPCKIAESALASVKEKI